MPDITDDPADPADPADPLAAAGIDGADGRRLLLFDDRPVLAFTPNRQQRPTADDAEPLADLAEVVPAVLAQLPGWWLSSPDPTLLDALLAAGATLVRHAHLYSRRLTPADAGLDGGFGPATHGVRVGPVTHTPAELAVVSALAYGPDHLDHLPGGEAEEAAELAQLLSGEMVGPVIGPATFEATADDGAPVGLIVVNRSPGPPPGGGPWVSQVFRHPDPAWAGLGARLVERAVGALAAGGDTTLGLAVTDGNPAERIYRRLGFLPVSSHRKLALPG